MLRARFNRRFKPCRARERINYFEKKWDPTSFTDDYYKEDDRYVDDLTVQISSEFEVPEAMNENYLDYFLGDTDESVTTKELRAVVEGVNIMDLEKGNGEAVRRLDAWVDDRSHPGSKNIVTEFGQFALPTLNASDLLRHLQKKRYGDLDKPDANRRLIFIRNLDQYFLTALAKSASSDQVPNLRDAMWSHLSFRASMRIKVAEMDFPRFHLELHLPYFTLQPRCIIDSTCLGVKGHLRRQWIDLSFLQESTQRLAPDNLMVAYETHVTVVLFGSAEHQWTAYCFEDCHSEDEELANIVRATPQDPTVNMDPLSNSTLDADSPFWDPRTYFMLVCVSRFTQMCHHWEALMLMVEKCLSQYRDNHPSTICKTSAFRLEQTEDVERTFDWTQKMINLLSRLIDVITGSIYAWKTFKSSTGDIGLLSDFYKTKGKTLSSIRASLCSIKETMAKVQIWKIRMEKLMENCKRDAESLQLRLTLEANNAVRNNGQQAAFTVSIISPVMVAIAFYSIPEGSAPFKLHSKYFALAILLIMAMVQVLFVVIQALPGKTWLLRQLTTWRGRIGAETFVCWSFVKRSATGGKPPSVVSSGTDEV